MQSMDATRYRIREFFITREGRWQPEPILPEPGANPGIDVVFPVLHGTFGEDGTVQGLLELAELPYVGPGVLASAVAMDKEMLKRVCRERGLPVADFVTLSSGCLDAGRVTAALPFPVFVKPANLGSSVGISKAGNLEQLHAALQLAAGYDHKIIVERGIIGREFECAVLGNQYVETSMPCEILPSREFYDYEDKYLLDKAVIELPAKLSADQTAELRRLAAECHRAAECEGMSRVDFLLETATGQIYINEINTIPGFTSISMFPKMWEHAGISYPALIDRLIELALERHQRRASIRYTR